MNVFFKSVFIVLVALLLSLQACAQMIPLSSLFRILGQNRDKIEDYTISKGYAYLDTQELDSNFKIVRYYHTNKSIYHSIVLKYYNESQLLEVGFTTAKQQEFAIIKSQIKERGYQFDSSENVENEFTQYNYKKRELPDYKITIYQYYTPETQSTNYHTVVQKEAAYVKAVKESRHKP